MSLSVNLSLGCMSESMGFGALAAACFGALLQLLLGAPPTIRKANAVNKVAPLLGYNRSGLVAVVAAAVTGAIGVVLFRRTGLSGMLRMGRVYNIISD